MLPFRDKKETKLSQNREKAGYEEIIDMNDGRINVMLLGTSGCGKSTLINAMLGEEKADTGAGEAVTKEIAVYQSDTLPFRMIDTVGYEFDFFHQHRIKNDIAKFGREGVRQKNVEKLIHMIWYCIDGAGIYQIGLRGLERRSDHSGIHQILLGDRGEREHRDG